MNLTMLDWVIVAAYFAVTIGIGLFFTRRGSESLSEYFISGRAVPWWLAGISMVATTFAADTPLVVAGLVASRGVAGNWLWWNMVMSGMLTVFFFARLWRRANVMTDVEFAEIRYSGRPAAFLRGFRAAYLATLVNLIIIGWVTRAMIKVLEISLGISPWTAIFICFVIVVLYAVAAGLWAVLWTDAVQFVLMMVAVIALAIFAVDAAGGMEAVKAGAAARFGSERAALSVLPVSIGADGITAYVWMPLMTLAVYLSVQWWATWYPGAEPGGGGYIAQRIFSAKTERDGMLAVLFFQVAHYAVRPWPWIITGLATLVLYPDMQDREGAYVHAFVDHLPPGWRGVMLAGFAAAYMSTMSTQLNWGASYLVNDVYRRFVRKDASDRHYVNAWRAATILLFACAMIVSWQIDTIEGAWKFLIWIGAGTGLVFILRWYWWRINAWSEISAMIASFVTSMVAIQIAPRLVPGGGPSADTVVTLLTVVVSTVVWVAVTFVTSPEPDRVLDAFYRRVRPGGPGWARVSERLGYGRESTPGGALAWTNWIAGIVAVYSSLFGVGRLVFGDLTQGAMLLVVAALAFAWIARSLGREERIYPEPAPHAEGGPPPVRPAA